VGERPAERAEEDAQRCGCLGDRLREPARTRDCRGPRIRPQRPAQLRLARGAHATPNPTHHRRRQHGEALGLGRLLQGAEQRARLLRLGQAPGRELVDRERGAAEIHARVGQHDLHGDVARGEAALIDQRDAESAQAGAERLVGAGSGHEEGLPHPLEAGQGAILLQHQDARPALREPDRRHESRQRPAQDHGVPAADPVALRRRDRREAAHQPPAGASGPNSRAGSSGSFASISPIR
jgi:hypothetical protein